MDARVINELLLNDKFAGATRMMALFFSNSIVKMLQAQKQLIVENEGLIVRLAKSLEIKHDLDLNRYAGIEMDDLMQER